MSMKEKGITIFVTSLGALGGGFLGSMGHAMMYIGMSEKLTTKGLVKWGLIGALAGGGAGLATRYAVSFAIECTRKDV
jgi:hypothetical protein